MRVPPEDGTGVEREFDPLGAPRAFGEAFGARTEHESAQLEQTRVAFADTELGERVAIRSGRARSENR